MGVFLDSIEITGLIIEEDFDTGISAISEEAQDGSIIIYEGNKLYRNIILIGGSDWGWLDKQTIQSVHSSAKIKGVTHTLDYDGDIFTVRFKTEDIPVIDGNPVIKRSNQQNTDWYNNITIKLMEV